MESRCECNLLPLLLPPLLLPQVPDATRKGLLRLILTAPPRSWAVPGAAINPLNSTEKEERDQAKGGDAGDNAGGKGDNAGGNGGNAFVAALMGGMGGSDKKSRKGPEKEGNEAGGGNKGGNKGGSKGGNVATAGGAVAAAGAAGAAGGSEVKLVHLSEEREAWLAKNDINSILVQERIETMKRDFDEGIF